MKQKGFTTILIILGVLITAIIVGGIYLIKNPSLIKTTPKACTMEAKICPDGTSVGRTGPNCEFSPCPATSSADISNWKIYINTKYSYQLQYPSTWLVRAMDNDKQLEQTSEANFRAVADETPDISGFSLSVISNPKNLSLTDWVKQNPDNGGLLPNVNGINSTVVSINGLNWEKFDEDSIGTVPTGYVKYALAHGGNLYHIVLYSADAKILDQILSTFKFTE
ncbi:MAG: hypothetical protein V1808_04075 [Candidatus Daviesbacteria bacterium]